MSELAGGRGDRVVRVLVMGADMRAERALMSRLRSAAHLHDDALVACDDPVTCDLMVVRDTSAMRNVALRMAASRPAMRLWILDDAGRLSDGIATPDVPIRDADVHALLRAIGGGGVSTPALDAAAVVRPAVIEPTFAAPDAVPLARQFRDHVHRAGGHATLLLDGEAQLLLDFGQRIAVTVGSGVQDAPATTLAQRFADLRLLELPADRFIARTRDRPVLPLIPLLWDLALQARGPRPLLAPLEAGSVLLLRQWPDFRALAHRHDHFRLCSLLLKRPSTAAEASTLLELPAADVHGFFNAAWLSGYAAIDTTRGAARAPTPAPAAGSGSRLARMWRNVRESLRT